MIIQTAPAGQPRLAIMMYEHTALCGQFARAFQTVEKKDVARVARAGDALDGPAAEWSWFEVK